MEYLDSLNKKFQNRCLITAAKPFDMTSSLERISKDNRMQPDELHLTATKNPYFSIDIESKG